MSFQKFRAGSLFTGTEMLPGSSVLVTDAAGTVVAVTGAEDAGSDVQQFSGILCPGFVNTHCHLELSHLEGMVPENTGLVDFLITVPRLRSFPQHTIQQAMQQAEAAMYSSGTVAVGDICNTADSIALKQQSRLHWHNFIEVLGFTAGGAAERFAFSEKIWQQFEAAMPGCNSLAPHAPYSASQELFGLINEAAAGRILTLHNQESEAENEWYRTKTGSLQRLYSALGINTDFFTASGKSSLQTCLPLMNRAASLLLVHNTVTTQNDLDFIRSTAAQPVFFCICPNASGYIQRRVPPVNLLRQNGCTITLGTDSLAGNRQLNMLEEIKTLLRHQPALPLAELLRWATLNGAEALQLQHRFGSFEKGKQPGIVLIENTGADGSMEMASARRL